ncbi:hypothetical protein PPYR_13089 [Photinus pyralis]|uniref:Uncharacterized protein n=1 Tax=Photinus pyralis TaxID=7054 RepID=A0A5N4A852_PHOPY|nr:uncharacterized protein LOC116179726 [Photinus pyralis]KAB0793469.1 hypothetical protein PPYR_13089 [Photinus pyralis]
MKAFIVLSACFVGFAASQGATKYMTTFMACMDDLGIDRSTLTEAMKNNPLDQPKLHELSECVFKKIGALNDDGTFDFTECKAQCEAEHNMDCSFLTKCLNFKGANESQRLVGVFLCGTKSYADLLAKQQRDG